MEVNEQTILETIALLKQKPSGMEQFRKWLPSILVVIGILTFVVSPFKAQEKRLHDVEQDVSSIQQFLWVEEPKSHDYLENPFVYRGFDLSLYGSEMYCKLAKK